MEFNFQMPTRAVQNWSSWIGGHHLSDVAVEAERAGFDYTSVTDHPYPHSDWLAHGGHHSFDPFVALSFMAASTTKIKLLTFVAVAGYRNPYITAKAAASVDLLSGGRLVLGMAAGYNAEEFAVLDASFGDRGKRFDAAIDAMRAAWSGEPADGLNPTYPAAGHIMLPRPIQQPGPPIWIGGNSRAAMRRAAGRGQCWMPFGQDERSAAVTKTPALSSITELAEKIGEYSGMCERAGESVGAVCFTPQRIRGVERQAEQVAADMSAYSDAGVACISLESQARGFAEYEHELAILRQLILR